MARNTGRRLRLLCDRDCPGWPERTHAAWGGTVVTCRCGARRYRPQSRSERLWRWVTRHARGTRLWERLKRAGWFSLLSAVLILLLTVGGPTFVLFRYLLVWRYEWR